MDVVVIVAISATLQNTEQGAGLKYVGTITIAGTMFTFTLWSSLQPPKAVAYVEHSVFTDSLQLTLAGNDGVIELTDERERLLFLAFLNGHHTLLHCYYNGGKQFTHEVTRPPSDYMVHLAPISEHRLVGNLGDVLKHPKFGITLN
jgi:hypothetical protein